MKGWLISIVGITLVGVLLDILLSDIKDNKFIKGIFSIACVLVIITPILSFIRSDEFMNFSLNSLEENSEYISSMQTYNEDHYESMVKKYLDSKSISYDSVESCIDYKGQEILLKLFNCSINDADKNDLKQILLIYFKNVSLIVM